MRIFEKNDAWYVEFTVREGEKLGLYKAPDDKRNPIQRGLSTDEAKIAKGYVAILDTVLAHAETNPDAQSLMQDLIRHRSLSFAELTGLWIAAQRIVGRNADAQLKHVLAARARVLLAPLVAVWGGTGGEGSPEQQGRNVQNVRRLIPVDSDLTVDQFTPRLIDAHLQSLLSVKTQYTNGQKPTSKRTVIKHRCSLNLFAEWLKTPSAANAAGLSVEQHVLQVNPVEAATDQRIVQTRGDRQQWKKSRVHYSQEEAHAIVDAAEGETRPLLALMMGSMVEWGAIYNVNRHKGPVGPVLFRRNFLRVGGTAVGQLTRAFSVAGVANRGDLTASGLKTKYRTRCLEIPDTEGHDFYWTVVLAHLMSLKDENAPFTTHSLEYHTNRFEAALKKVGIKRTHGRLFHVCRHTFAQFWLRKVLTDARPDGRDIYWLMQQAGHSEEGMMLFREYTDMKRRQHEGEQFVDEELSRTQRGVALVSPVG